MSMTYARLSAHATIAAAASDHQARTFRLTAYTGSPMDLGGFALPVVVDLPTLDLSGLPIPALYDHHPDINSIVGVVDSARVHKGQLIASGRFTPSSDPEDVGAFVLEKADAGFEWQASIGASTSDPTCTQQLIREGETGTANEGRRYPGPVVIVRGAILREISFVSLGADRDTAAVVARGGSVVDMAAALGTHYHQGGGYFLKDPNATILAIVAREGGQPPRQSFDNDTLRYLVGAGLVDWWDECQPPRLTDSGWDRAAELLAT